jgi:HAMP domain-containing protein
MEKQQVLCLWVAAGLLITLAVLPASAGTVTEDSITIENETDEINLTAYSTSSYNETEAVETEIGLGFKFLKSMLSLLDLNLNLINETLSKHSEEYPFLQPTIEGTETGINAVNSSIAFVEDPTNMSKANDTMHTFDDVIADLNASLVYPQDMLDAANATLGQPESTTPILEDMYKITKAMVTVYDRIES